MLSSRYLHLHEALGLGPMWLKRGAKTIPAAFAAPKAGMPKPEAASVQTTIPRQERTLSAGAHQARLSAIAAVHGGNQQDVAEREMPSPQTAAVEAARQPEAKPKQETPADKQTRSIRNTADLPAAPHLSDDLPRLSATVKTARLMVVSICPSTEDTLHGELFHGETGVLLDNMLAAIRLSPQQAHKTSWVKAAPVFSPHPSEAQIHAELLALKHELESSQARAVLFLGQVFEQREMMAVMDELCGGIPYFTIPHPARLLRQPRLKAYAWQVLKKAAAVL